MLFVLMFTKINNMKNVPNQTFPHRKLRLMISKKKRKKNSKITKRTQKSNKTKRNEMNYHNMHKSKSLSLDLKNAS